METLTTDIINQHLIDPEICIRRNTCEATWPIDAIDNRRREARASAYGIDEQFEWEELPEELNEEQLAQAGVNLEQGIANPEPVVLSLDAAETGSFNTTQFDTSLPSWSAAHAYTNLYGPLAEKKFISATVVGNFRVTEIGREYDTHHIMLDFEAIPFPVPEGQSIGIIPSETDNQGRAHHARQYSIASPRNGEHPGCNNVSLAVKRVLENHDGNPVRGVASNYMCDLKVGDPVDVIGPFDNSFLMPNRPRSSIVMICTGTGSAPMRAKTEWRRRLPTSGKFEGGKLMLFFGERSKEELPYFGPLQNLPKDFIDINLAFARVPDQPKRHVQDVVRERAVDLAELLKGSRTFFYVCGLKDMAEGVALALCDIAEQVGMSWERIGTELRRQGRLHMEAF
ncbi:MAG: benzoyl-CoA 2,3-epoxidase subunit BoxA [Gammaproteobacteria bacterium]|nr:benzoyl-CoA 2,3-epoxidase subunit BoxA [Gammaproteobacteria bacterium]